MAFTKLRCHSSFKSRPSEKGIVIPGFVVNKLRQAASLRSSVEDSLTAAIISGELLPGTLLTVPTLAAQFEVSATPVREAMLQLEDRGLVETVKNKGFRITDVSENDLEEIAQLRRWLEAPAMRIVATQLQGNSLEHFRELAERIVWAAERANFQKYLVADTAFHLELLRLTGNGRLVDMVAELRRQTRMVGLKDMTRTKELEESANEHLALLDLLNEGNGAEAETLMNRHVGHVVGWWAGVPEAPDH